jgi:hypothetical protein
VFLVDRGAQTRVAAAAESLGTKMIPVRLAPHGVRVRAVPQ